MKGTTGEEKCRYEAGGTKTHNRNKVERMEIVEKS